MHRTSMVCCAYIALISILVGCTSAPTKLEPPAEALLVSPKALAKMKAGDDLVDAHAKLRRSYATETGKLRRLQSYVKTVLGK